MLAVPCVGGARHASFMPGPSVLALVLWLVLAFARHCCVSECRLWWLLAGHMALLLCSGAAAPASGQQHSGVHWRGRVPDTWLCDSAVLPPLEALAEHYPHVLGCPALKQPAPWPRPQRMLQPRRACCQLLGLQAGICT
jgi:hypothetical protein